MKWKFIEETLAEKYPYIDTTKHLWCELANSSTEYGVGWHDLIIELFMKIEKIYEENNVDITEFKITQIKEKYGSLRVYVCSSMGEVHELINEYEKKSETVCEECGKEGRLHEDANGWLFTLCDDCALERGCIKDS